MIKSIEYIFFFSNFNRKYLKVTKIDIHVYSFCEQTIRMFYGELTLQGNYKNTKGHEHYSLAIISRILYFVTNTKGQEH